MSGQIPFTRDFSAHRVSVTRIKWNYPLQKQHNRHALEELLKTMTYGNDLDAEKARLGVLDLIRHSQPQFLFENLRAGGLTALKHLLDSALLLKHGWNSLGPGLEVFEGLLNVNNMIREHMLRYWNMLLRPVQRHFSQIEHTYGFRLLSPNMGHENCPKQGKIGKIPNSIQDHIFRIRPCDPDKTRRHMPNTDTLVFSEYLRTLEILFVTSPDANPKTTNELFVANKRLDPLHKTIRDMNFKIPPRRSRILYGPRLAPPEPTQRTKAWAPQPTRIKVEVEKEEAKSAQPEDEQVAEFECGEGLTSVLIDSPAHSTEDRNPDAPPQSGVSFCEKLEAQRQSKGSAARSVSVASFSVRGMARISEKMPLIFAPQRHSLDPDGVLEKTALQIVKEVRKGYPLELPAPSAGSSTSSFPSPSLKAPKGLRVSMIRSFSGILPESLYHFVQDHDRLAFEASEDKGSDTTSSEHALMKTLSSDPQSTSSLAREIIKLVLNGIIPKPTQFAIGLSKHQSTQSVGSMRSIISSQSLFDEPSSEKPVSPESGQALERKTSVQSSSGTKTTLTDEIARLIVKAVVTDATGGLIDENVRASFGSYLSELNSGSVEIPRRYSQEESIDALAVNIVEKLLSGFIRGGVAKSQYGRDLMHTQARLRKTSTEQSVSEESPRPSTADVAAPKSAFGIGKMKLVQREEPDEEQSTRSLAIEIIQKVLDGLPEAMASIPEAEAATPALPKSHSSSSSTMSTQSLARAILAKVLSGLETETSGVLVESGTSSGTTPAVKPFRMSLSKTSREEEEEEPEESLTAIVSVLISDIVKEGVRLVGEALLANSTESESPSETPLFQLQHEKTPSSDSTEALAGALVAQAIKQGLRLTNDEDMVTPIGPQSCSKLSLLKMQADKRSSSESTEALAGALVSAAVREGLRLTNDADISAPDYPKVDPTHSALQLQLDKHQSSGSTEALALTLVSDAIREGLRLTNDAGISSPNDPEPISKQAALQPQPDERPPSESTEALADALVSDAIREGLRLTNDLGILMPHDPKSPSKHSAFHVMTSKGESKEAVIEAPLLEAGAKATAGAPSTSKPSTFHASLERTLGAQEDREDSLTELAGALISEVVTGALLETDEAALENRPQKSRLFEQLPGPTGTQTSATLELMEGVFTKVAEQISEKLNQHSTGSMEEGDDDEDDDADSETTRLNRQALYVVQRVFSNLALQSSAASEGPKMSRSRADKAATDAQTEIIVSKVLSGSRVLSFTRSTSFKVNVNSAARQLVNEVLSEAVHIIMGTSGESSAALSGPGENSNNSNQNNGVVVREQIDCPPPMLWRPRGISLSKAVRTGRLMA